MNNNREHDWELLHLLVMYIAFSSVVHSTSRLSNLDIFDGNFMNYHSLFTFINHVAHFFISSAYYVDYACKINEDQHERSLEFVICLTILYILRFLKRCNTIINYFSCNLMMPHSHYKFLDSLLKSTSILFVV